MLLLRQQHQPAIAGRPARRACSSNTISSRARRRALRRLATADTADAAPPLPTSAPLALKEWAVAIDALLAGDQVVLLRKGGLYDGKFKLPAREFLLFPTTFHVDPDDSALLAAGAGQRFSAALAMPEPKTLAGPIPIKCRAVVEQAWSVTDGAVVEALAAEPGLHVWGPAFAEARMKWRPGSEMSLLLVRAYGGGGGGGGGSGGSSPLRVRQRSDYYGCFSWVRVEPEQEEGEQQQAVWRPVLDDGEFARRGEAVRRAMASAGIKATPLELP